LIYGGTNNGKIEINEYEVIDTPVNSIRDGKIINLTAISAAVGEAVKRQKMNGNKVVLNITGTGVITRDIKLPKSTDEEIEKILEFEAQQYFPVELENYVLDFKILEEITEPEGVFTRVLLVAVPNKQIEEYIKLPRLIKKDITAIDLPANCIAKFLFGSASTKEGSKLRYSEMPDEFAVVDIGYETTGVCIFYGEKLKFNRILLNGSKEIDMVISNSNVVDFEQTEKDRVEKLKILNDEVMWGEAPEERYFNGATKSSVDNLLNDINRFFEFYFSRSAGNRLQKIYICGGGSRIKGLDSYMTAYFNIPVECLQVDGRVAYTGKKNQEDFAKDFVVLTGALGALVR